MNLPLHTDVLVIGGGIAGLWTLARLRSAGLSAVLLARGGLGAGQTIWSQGIIHGGVKYALGGGATRASRAIADMPARWLRCLEGQGELDLSAVRPFEPRQHLWTTGGIISRLAGLAASQAIRTPVERVEVEARPPALAGAPRGVSIYTVGEPVLPVHCVLAALADQLHGALLAIEKVEAIDLTPSVTGGSPAGRRVIVRASARDVHAGPDAPATDTLTIHARRIVLAAGAGNPELLARAGLPADVGPAAMQRRPLHMAVARGPLPVLCGHCLAGSSTPRLTITTAGDDRAPAGERTWLIGGQVAEEGVTRTPAEQARAVRGELAECLPWLDLSALRLGTGRIDRAEARTADGHKPDGPIVRPLLGGRVLLTWPTKLAFAPLLAAAVLDELRLGGLEPGPTDLSVLDRAHHAGVADYPWDRPAAEQGNGPDHAGGGAFAWL